MGARAGERPAPGRHPRPRRPREHAAANPRPYTTSQVLAYWKHCDDMVDAAVRSLDLQSSESGFHWYRFPKLEHQIVNLRHIQNHTAQLGDRLRASTGTGIRWVGAHRGP